MRTRPRTTSDSVGSDQWGVPVRMFGPVEEDFYGLVGRVVLLSTLLEDRLHVFFCALSGAPQSQLAAAPGAILIKQCSRRLDRLPADRRSEASTVLIEAEEALRRRNEVVHSLWPFADRSAKSAAGVCPEAARRTLNTEWSGRSFTRVSCPTSWSNSWTSWTGVARSNDGSHHQYPGRDATSLAGPEG